MLENHQIVKLLMIWQPIEDILSNCQNLASSELRPLVTVWNEQAERLRASGEFKVLALRYLLC